MLYQFRQTILIESFTGELNRRASPGNAEQAMRPIEIALPRLHAPNIRAITLWPFILYRRGDEGDPALRCHEFYHWREARRWGVIPWYLTYLLLLPFYFRKDPREHPLEAKAYEHQFAVEAKIRNGETVEDPWL